jgi:hypothetical protein
VDLIDSETRPSGTLFSWLNVRQCGAELGKNPSISPRHAFHLQNDQSRRRNGDTFDEVKSMGEVPAPTIAVPRLARLPRPGNRCPQTALCPQCAAIAVPRLRCPQSICPQRRAKTIAVPRLSSPDYHWLAFWRDNRCPLLAFGLDAAFYRSFAARRPLVLFPT